MKRIAITLSLLVTMAVHAGGINLGDTTHNHGGDAEAQAAALAVAIQKQVQLQVQAQLQGQHQNAKAISGGNTQAVNVEASESNTPPVIAGALPSVPTTCRLYLFGGGSTRDGAGSGTFPIGNDRTCLSIAKLNMMDRTGGFSQAEKQTVVCEVEGMDVLNTCKNLGAKKTAAAPAGTEWEHANLSDPYIARRQAQQ